MQVHRAIKSILLALLAADLLFLLAVKTPARLFALSAAGRSGCALESTLASYHETKEALDLRRQFHNAMRIVSRDPAGLELWDTPKGQIWTPQNDEILPFLLAEQQRQIYGSGNRGVHPGDVVLDCGANIGTFTKTALASGARLVVAIELAPVTLECLRRNVANEIAQGRVIVYPKGVWDRDASLDLALNEHNAGANSVVMDRGRQKVRVPLTTIDKIVGELGLRQVDFIKMDIEGAEKQALAGGRATIQRFRPRMAISSEHLEDDVQKIPLAVSQIRPDYHLEFTDCEDEGFRVQPLVIQFF